MKKQNKKKTKSTQSGPRKGRRVERDICKRLSLWWSCQTRDDIFWRSVTSGGAATQRAKKGKTLFGQAGDVQAIDPSGVVLIELFSIEIKAGYKNWCALDVVEKKKDAKPTTLEKFITQAREQCDNNQTELIIVQRDRKDALIVMPSEVYLHIADAVRTADELATAIKMHVLSVRVYELNAPLHYRIMKLQDFFDWCNPRTIKEMA